MGRFNERRKRQRAEQRGRYAELYAGCFLLIKGYWPLAYRYRTPYGEIDWVVKKKNVVVFVEVKSRAAYLSASESIDPHKQGRIARSAAQFLSNHMRTRQSSASWTARGDAVLVWSWGRIVHIPDAFRLGCGNPSI